MSKDKKDTWYKPRHKFIERLASPFFALHCSLKYNFKAKKVKLPKEACLILANHDAALDPVFIGLVVKKPIYFVSMDDLLASKFPGRLLKYWLNPIPKAKGIADIRCIKLMMKTLKEGQNVCLFPTGSRSYDGELCSLDPSISKLLKVLKVPVVFMNIIGNYGGDPRWGNKPRRGYMETKIRCIMSKDEIQSLSNEELYSKCIEYLNAGNEVIKPFKSKRSAEYIERILFRCPDCGTLNSIYSKGNYFECTHCGLKMEYTPNLTFNRINGNTNINNVREWYLDEASWIKSLDFTNSFELFKEEGVSLYDVERLKEKHCIYENAKVTCYSDHIHIEKDNESFELNFNEIDSSAIIGKNKCNFYQGEKTYQFIGNERFNAIKYVMIYFHYRNTIKNELSPNEYLGI